jgi:hypothetical protein
LNAVWGERVVRREEKREGGKEKEKEKGFFGGCCVVVFGVVWSGHQCGGCLEKGFFRIVEDEWSALAGFRGDFLPF